MHHGAAYAHALTIAFLQCFMSDVKRDTLRPRYSRDELVSLYCTASPVTAVADRVRGLGLWSVCRLYSARRRKQMTYRLCSYRGCRAGRSKRKPARLFPVGNGASIITGNRPVPNIDSSRQSNRSNSSLLSLDRRRSMDANKRISQLIRGHAT